MIARLPASALYISIIVALIIAVITSSLITVAYFYRQENRQNERYNRLSNNLESGIQIVLSQDFNTGERGSVVDLYNENADSVILIKEHWGIFDIGTAKSFTQRDTLKKAFLIGTDTPQNGEVLYLTDEDRPLSLSGSTAITGDSYLPKAGIRSAFVEGKPYKGRELIKGNKEISGKSLPPLIKEILEQIKSGLVFNNSSKFPALSVATDNSFFKNELTCYAGTEIHDIKIRGKVILLSDTIVKISRSAILRDVILFAPAFIIEEGFRGSCQIFARDSIVTGKKVMFDYPSALGIIKPGDSKIQAKISLGPESRFAGILFTWEDKRSDLQTMISLGKNTEVEGEVYSSGFLKLEKPVRIAGKVSCNRFIVKTPVSLYENYLIDIELNRAARSNYYLSSRLFDNGNPESKILRWLN